MPFKLNYPHHRAPIKSRLPHLANMQLTQQVITTAQMTAGSLHCTEVSSSKDYVWNGSTQTAAGITPSLWTSSTPTEQTIQLTDLERFGRFTASTQMEVYATRRYGGHTDFMPPEKKTCSCNSHQWDSEFWLGTNVEEVNGFKAC